VADDKRSWRVAGVGLFVATSLVLAACGSSNNDNNTTASSTSPSTTATATSTSATATPSGASGAVALAAKGNELAFNSTSETAKAGKVAVKFTNDSSLGHNVTLVDTSNKILGKTPTFQGGTKTFSATLKSGYLHVLLLSARPSPGGHAGNVDGAVAPPAQGPEEPARASRARMRGLSTTSPLRPQTGEHRLLIMGARPASRSPSAGSR
jgi:plastocyanin